MNMKAELELMALQSTMGQNGPPIDQAKMHDFVNRTDEMLNFLGAHVAAQVAAEAPPAPDQSSQGSGAPTPTPAPAAPESAPEPPAPVSEAAPSTAPSG
jgi:hypothetical protein